MHFPVRTCSGKLLTTSSHLSSSRCCLRQSSRCCPTWRSDGATWIGALVTSALFVIGKTLIGLYLGHASVGSTYGAAGSLLVFLVWVYYSAQILFFGAEFTQVYARQLGRRIVPSPGAVPLRSEEKLEQGLKPAGAPNKQPSLVGVGPVATSSAVMTPAGPVRDSGALKKLIWTGLSATTM